MLNIKWPNKTETNILAYVEIDNLNHKLIRHCYGPFGEFTQQFDLPKGYEKEIKYNVNDEEVIQTISMKSKEDGNAKIFRNNFKRN